MKKKQLKMIRKMAEVLPQSFYETGNDNDVLVVNQSGKTIVGVRLINHVRRLKKAFQEGGDKAMYAYVDQFFEHHKKMLMKYSDLLKTKAPEEATA